MLNDTVFLYKYICLSIIMDTCISKTVLNPSNMMFIIYGYYLLQVEYFGDILVLYVYV